jgi:hypothetical protein
MFGFGLIFAARAFKNQMPLLALFVGKLRPIHWRLRRLRSPHLAEWARVRS